MRINPVFQYGQVVYFKVDKDQTPYVITYYVLYPEEIKYAATYMGDTVVAYEFELSDTKDILLSTTN